MKLYNDKQIETLTSEDVLLLDENNKEMDYDNVRQEFLRMDDDEWFFHFQNNFATYLSELKYTLIQMRNMGLHSAKEVVEKMRTLSVTKFASDMESYLDGTRNVRHSYVTNK